MGCDHYLVRLRDRGQLLPLPQPAEAAGGRLRNVDDASLDQRAQRERVGIRLADRDRHFDRLRHPRQAVDIHGGNGFPIVAPVVQNTPQSLHAALLTDTDRLLFSTITDPFPTICHRSTTAYPRR